MNKNYIPMDISKFPRPDKEKDKETIIEATKIMNKLVKESRSQAKQRKCYYCGRECESFCNSHTLPAFCLKNIAKNGKVFYANSIIELPTLKEEKGVNEAGTFHLICRECDGKVFQDYENPENYDSKPTIKMLAQIDMKNNLKNISKRLLEKEMYKKMPEKIGMRVDYAQSKNDINDLDLKEYKDDYMKAKKRSIKPFSGEYYIGYYAKLPYVVPVAFQGTIALVCDLEGNIINDIYEYDPKYRVKNMSLCIFPLKETSIVMIFVAKGNNRYSRFFRQLNKIENLEEQLSVINYILFAYSEDFFLSCDIPKDELKKLMDVTGTNSDLLSLIPPSKMELQDVLKEMYSLDARNTIPNLLVRNHESGCL